MYQISDDCNIDLAIISCKELINMEKNKHHSFNSNLFACVTIEMAKKFYGEITTYRLSKISNENQIDINIRKLSINNTSEIIRLCRRDYDIDTVLGKILADNFIKFDWNDHYEAIGYYLNDQLIGIASYWFSKEANIAELANIYVSPNFRKNNIGKKLVYGATAMYPWKYWLYQAGLKNSASLQLALSTGFQIIGAELWIENE